MKKSKRLLASLLAVVMILSMLTGLTFAEEPAAKSLRNDTEKSAIVKADEPSISKRGADGEKIDLPQLAEKPADDELVTAIVLLQGKPAADVSASEQSARRAALSNQQGNVLRSMSRANVSYKLVYTYDTLLNAVAVRVPYGDLAKIAAMDGVEAVHIATEYAEPTVTKEESTRMESSNMMTGSAMFQQAGYKGDGMIIAVLDTGITPKHEAFQVYGDHLKNAALSEEAVKAVGLDHGTYLSQKIPFSYDYADVDEDATDDTSGHGTHVSGIAAGYVETEEGEITFCGTAPHAQILAMKIFHSGQSGTNTAIYFKALEDAYKLGADVINMSIGAQNGNTYDPEIEELYDDIFNKLESLGVICAVAAGNEGSMADNASSWAGNGYVTSDYTDYGVVASPSTYDGNMSVASVDNAFVPANVFEVNEKQYAYYDRSDDGSFYALVAGEELEYVIIDGFGEAKDYVGVDVDGKIAVVSRGSITFSEKVKNAADAGAIAILVYNNQPGIIYMSVDKYYIPAASITQEAGQALIDNAEMPGEAEEPTSVTVTGTLRAVEGAKDAAVSKNASNAVKEKKQPGVSATRAGEELGNAILTWDFEEDEEWTFVDADGDGYNWDYYTSENYAMSGSGFLASESYVSGVGAVTPDNWAISPAFRLEGISDASLSLWATDFGYTETFAVYAGTSADPEAMDKLGADIETEEEYTQYTFDLSAYADQTIYVAIRHYNVTDSFYLLVDDVEILSPTASSIEPIIPDHELPENAVAGWYFETKKEIADWTFVDADGDGENWYRYPAKDRAYEGKYVLTSASYAGSALTPDNWAITPAVDLTGVEEVYLSLYYAGQDPSYAAEHFMVYAGYSADPSDMTAISNEIVAEGGYKNLQIDLGDYAGETIYIGIRHFNVTDMFRLNIDQVEILKGVMDPPEEPKELGDPILGWYFEEAGETKNWSFVDADGDGYNWFRATESEDKMTPYEGDGLLTSESFHNYEDEGGTVLEPDNWAITPCFALTGIDDATLSFYACGQDVDWASEVFAVYVGTSNNPDDMVKVTDDIVTTSTYKQYTVDLSAYKDQTICVAIRHYNITDMFMLNVDQVEILSPTADPIEEIVPEPVARPVGTVGFPEGLTNVPNETGWQPSSFSNWGPTPILTLKPMIAGVGGTVYSATNVGSNTYEAWSGTSMATPNISGVMANLSQYLNEKFGDGAPMGVGSNPFTDVKAGEYYTDAVLWAVGHEPQITNGTSATTFSPAQKCTRGQIVTFLWRAMGEPLPEKAENVFTDVKESDYFYKAVQWAVQNGITKGTSETTFSPSNTCTRGQAVTFLWRAMGEPAPTSTANPFTDVKAGQYYTDAVLWAVEKEITNGTSKTTFSPDANCTRGQIVTFLFRTMKTTLTKRERAELAEDLVKSTALVLTDGSGNLASPRKQGAGLANMELLTAANAYVTEPIQNVGDSADGKFEFTFTVKDLYGKGGTYDITPIFVIDTPAQADINGDGKDETYNTLTSAMLEKEKEFTFTTDAKDDTVTVAPNGAVDVKVTLELTAELKAELDELYPNGCYIEGYIFLSLPDAEKDGEEDEEEFESIHVTVLGYYGDWNKAPVLEEHDWREAVDMYNFWNYAQINEDGDTYADLYPSLDWTALNKDFQFNTQPSYAYSLNSYGLSYYAEQIGSYSDLGFANVLYDFLMSNGIGGFAGDNPYGLVDYNDDHIVITNDSSADYPIDTLLMIPYTLRNARHVLMVVTDAKTGAIYNIDDTEYLSKAFYDDSSSIASTYGNYWENTGIFMYDGTDLDGKPVPDGTKVNINFYANTMYGEDEIGKIIGEEKDYSKLAEAGKDLVAWSYSCYVDNSAPVIGEPVIDKDAGTVTVKIKDAHYVAAVAAFDENGTVFDQVAPEATKTGEETEVTFKYAEGAKLLHIIAVDYAGNQCKPVPVFIEEPTYVTIHFAHPEGTELSDYEDDYKAYVGEFIYMPDLTDPEGAEFGGYWTPYDMGEVDEGYLDLYEAFGYVYSVGGTYVVTAESDGLTFNPIYKVTIPGTVREEEAILGWDFETDPAEDGWTFVDGDEDTYNWTWNTDESHEAFDGVGCIYSASYINGLGALEPDNWAITPAIDMSKLTKASLSLWAVGQDPSYCEENFRIYAGTTANPEEMTEVTDEIVASGLYTNYVVDLSDYAGKEAVYVAIRHYNVTDQYHLNVDLVEVYDSVVEPMVPPTHYFTTDLPGAAEAGWFLSGVLSDGDKVVIRAVKDGAALTNEASTYNLKGKAIDAMDGALTEEPTEDMIWTVSVKENGDVTFTDKDGKTLAAVNDNAGHINLKVVTDEASELIGLDWTIEHVEESGFIRIKNATIKYVSGETVKDQYIEYYNGEFKPYGLTSSTDPFDLEFYIYDVPEA